MQSMEIIKIVELIHLVADGDGVLYIYIYIYMAKYFILVNIQSLSLMKFFQFFSYIPWLLEGILLGF